MSQKQPLLNTAQAVLSNPQFLSVVTRFQEKERQQHESLMKTMSDGFLKAMTIKRFAIYKHIEVSSSEWKPCIIKSAIKNGSTLMKIVIPHRVKVSEPDTIQWSDTQMMYTYEYSLEPAIELLVHKDGHLSTPAGMDGKDRMIMEFPDLADFITYLEEEMAKGNYPRHLSSDWR